MSNEHHKNAFDRFASFCAHLFGKSKTFALALAIVVVWGATGPLFHYSETWQLVINTGTTIITFLLLFLVQNTQNRDTAALHLKLDAIIYAMTECDNELMKAEELSQKEIEAIIREYRAKKAAVEGKA